MCSKKKTKYGPKMLRIIVFISVPLHEKLMRLGTDFRLVYISI